jgi:hypothetical protein
LATIFISLENACMYYLFINVAILSLATEIIEAGNSGFRKY